MHSAQQGLMFEHQDVDWGAPWGHFAGNAFGISFWLVFANFFVNFWGSFLDNVFVMIWPQIQDPKEFMASPCTESRCASFGMGRALR